MTIGGVTPITGVRWQFPTAMLYQISRGYLKLAQARPAAREYCARRAVNIEGWSSIHFGWDLFSHCFRNPIHNTGMMVISPKKADLILSDPLGGIQQRPSTTFWCSQQTWDGGIPLFILFCMYNMYRTDL